jgi:ABC-type phosphate transport system substrate-binding protein/Tol biopolymer transport system component
VKKSAGKFHNIARMALASVAVLLATSFSPPKQYTVSQIQPEATNDLLTGDEAVFWVEVTVYDPSITPSYEWEVDAGQIVGDGSGDRILYVAPDQPGTVEMSVTVRGGGEEVSAHKTLSVTPRVLPNITEDQIYTAKEGDTLSKIAGSMCSHRESDFAAIQYFTNLRCQQDKRFDCVDDPDSIDVGWTLYMPTCQATSNYWLDQLEVLPTIDWSLPAEEIRVDGSATLLPLTSRVGELFKALGFDGNLSVESSGVDDGFASLCNGQVDLVDASRPMTDQELASCRQAGRDSVAFQVGWDAVVIVVSRENDFIDAQASMTLVDLRQILSTAGYWSDITPEWDTAEISRFYPGQESDALDLVATQLFEGDPNALLAAGRVTSYSRENEIIKGIQENPNAVGLVSYAAYANNKETLKALKVAGGSPTPENVASGAYALARPLAIYSSAQVMHEKPQVAAFINFYLRSARQVMADAYFPANEDEFRQSKLAFIQATSRVPAAPLAAESAPEGAPGTPTPVGQQPSIGVITFAVDVTADNQPVGADTSFYADIPEIHAIFSYAGMSDGDNWERIWYQDGEQVSGGPDTWDGGESGTFDLSLSNDGKPLGSGTWRLEIYVNGELARSGTFVIESGASSTTQPATSTPAPAVAAYQIAFSRWDGGKHDMFTAKTDGSGEQFLLERAAGPSWSPSGQYLSFYGEEGVDRQVRNGVEYAVSGITNGILWVKVANFPSDITQVEVGQYVREGSARWTAWSPNGDMLAFDAARGGPDRRIYFLGTEDNQQFNIEIPGEQADWSPNSNQVVYRSGRDGKQGIWISNRDDSGTRNITNDGSDSFPAWSPDGQSIAFHRDSGGNVDIYVMNVDGGNVRRLTDAAGPDTLPAWTPDGRIVFRSARGGSWGIYIMNADGSNQQRVIANADPGPDWAFGRMDVH